MRDKKTYFSNIKAYLKESLVCGPKLKEKTTERSPVLDCFFEKPLNIIHSMSNKRPTRLP